MHLLLLSCSKVKRKDEGPCRAMDLYDGPSFRILRKMEREGRMPKGLDIMIVSGKYGIIGSNDEIEYYDRIIDGDVIASTKSRQKLQGILSRGYDGVFVNMGKNYIWHFSDILKGNIFANGRIGEKNAQMKRWILSL